MSDMTILRGGNIRDDNNGADNRMVSEMIEKVKLDIIITTKIQSDM